MTGILTSTSSISMNEFVEIPLSKDEEQGDDLPGHILKEETSLITSIEPKRFSFITNKHILVGMITSVVLIAIGLFLFIAVGKNKAAVYTGCGLGISGSILLTGTFLLLHLKED